MLQDPEHPSHKLHHPEKTKGKEVIGTIKVVVGGASGSGHISDYVMTFDMDIAFF